MGLLSSHSLAWIPHYWPYHLFMSLWRHGAQQHAGRTNRRYLLNAAFAVGKPSCGSSNLQPILVIRSRLPASGLGMFEQLTRTGVFLSKLGLSIGSLGVLIKTKATCPHWESMDLVPGKTSGIFAPSSMRRRAVVCHFIRHITGIPEPSNLDLRFRPWYLAVWRAEANSTARRVTTSGSWRACSICLSSGAFSFKAMVNIH